MSSDNPTPFALYKLYLDTAEKVSDRRASANSWMLSVNSAIVALYGYIAHGEASVGDAERSLWQWAIPLAGILVCVAWAGLLDSYRKLNGAKFKVLQTIEQGFPHQPFSDEQLRYREAGRKPLARIEGWVPWSFVALYAILLFAAVVL